MGLELIWKDEQCGRSFVLVLLLQGKGKGFLVPGFGRDVSQSRSRGKGQFWTDHVKCEQLGQGHNVPYSL